MRISALERLFVTERLPRRATMHGDFAQALLHERAVDPAEAPFLVTNNRRKFVQTRRRPDGTIWAGFSDVPLGTEAHLVQELYRTLWELSAASGWLNRCTSLGETMHRAQTLGFEPRCLTVPVSLLKEACGAELTIEDAEKLMLGQGFVAKAGDVFVLAADLMPGQAMLTAAPKVMGTYTRADQALALMVFRADRAVVLVGEEPPEHGVA